MQLRSLNEFASSGQPPISGHGSPGNRGGLNNPDQEFEFESNPDFEVDHSGVSLPGFEDLLLRKNPAYVQAVAKKYPGHGPFEAINKAYNIVSYGPSYRNSQAAFDLLVKYWNLSGDQLANHLLKNNMGSGDEEFDHSVVEWLQQNA